MHCSTRGTLTPGLFFKHKHSHCQKTWIKVLKYSLCIHKYIVCGVSLLRCRGKYVDNKYLNIFCIRGQKRSLQTCEMRNLTLIKIILNILHNIHLEYKLFKKKKTHTTSSGQRALESEPYWQPMNQFEHVHSILTFH